MTDVSGGCSSGVMQTETRLEEAKGTITRLAMEMAIKGLLRRIRMKSGERKKQLSVVGVVWGSLEGSLFIDSRLKRFQHV